MKLIAVFFVVILAGAFATTESPSTTVKPETTPAPSNAPTGPTPAEGSTASPASTTVGPTVPPVSTVSGETNAPTDSTGAPVTTVPTEPPTTTIPLNRNVSFNVNCEEKTSCKFTFTIDERLVRSINNTALEVVLSQLSTSINNASASLVQLGYDEETYSQDVNAQIEIAQSEADSISVQYNETSIQVDDLSDQTASALETAKNYLKSAICFQTDGDSSYGCGQLADLSY
uniref:DUF725 domain-containing protein n=1 Tax=Panagrellus redivivus TaxID=6233 RepID=A0A7E4V809_PANRE